MFHSTNLGWIDVIKRVTENNFRCIFLIVGPFPKYQVPFIHYKWSKISSKIRKPILWCYKDHKSSPFKNFTQTNGKNKEKRKNFLKFFNQTNIKFCFHDQTTQILGETFGLCVIENIETISPNVLARVIETIEGGGVIIFLLETKNQVKNLNNLSNNSRIKFKSFPYRTWTGRFFDILLFSLHECPTFVALDDKLDFLRKKEVKFIKKFIDSFQKRPQKNSKKNLLYELVQNIQGMEPLGNLASKAKTFDQARAFLTFAEAVVSKKNFNTIILTSARGRGKSAVLGLSSASAIAYGCGNIFVTSPHPENLHSFFAFLFIGFRQMNYKENLDYEIIQNTKFKFIEKVRISSTHRQEISFVFPHEIKEKKNQIDLLIIEEAAAIPEEDFKTLLGPYNIFISSTNSGYEGSGRTLCVKMLNNIKEFHHISSASNSETTRTLKEIILEEPIRYSECDPVEKWINKLLCLDPLKNPVFLSGCPDPNICKIFLVDRNALFSGHKVSRCLIQKIFNIFAFSHYKNSPDDLQLLCDAPSHRILIMVPPFNFSIGFLPDILCALHISYEGQISRSFVQRNLLKNRYVSGDLIPWVVSKYNLDSSFAELSGIRIIRIATHPDIKNMGYGSKTLSLLQKILKERNLKRERKKKIESKRELLTHWDISPILVNMEERKNFTLDYIGVSFCLTLPLFCFWRKNGFSIVFLQGDSKKFSTEKVCIMINPRCIKKQKPLWFKNYRREFFRKFTNLLGNEFKSIPTPIVYNIIENIKLESKRSSVTKNNIKKFLTPFDFNRLFFFLEKNFIGVKIISDLLPTLARIILSNFLKKDNLSYVENLVIIGIGSQNKTIHEIKKELCLKTFIIILTIKNFLTKLIKNF